MNETRRNEEEEFTTFYFYLPKRHCSECHAVLRSGNRGNLCWQCEQKQTDSVLYADMLGGARRQKTAELQGNAEVRFLLNKGVMRVCQNKVCSLPFQPINQEQQFCSDSCQRENHDPGLATKRMLLIPKETTVKPRFVPRYDDPRPNQYQHTCEGPGCFNMVKTGNGLQGRPKRYCSTACYQRSAKDRRRGGIA